MAVDGGGQRFGALWGVEVAPRAAKARRFGGRMSGGGYLY